jgi:hypothetical protein
MRACLSFLKGNRIDFIGASAFKKCDGLQHLSYDGDEENDIQCGSPDGEMACPITDLTFTPQSWQLKDDSYGNPVFTEALEATWFNEAEGGIVGAVTYQVEPYTY